MYVVGSSTINRLFDNTKIVSRAAERNSSYPDCKFQSDPGTEGQKVDPYLLEGGTEARGHVM